jgi:excisionase family DNA binding protein
MVMTTHTGLHPQPTTSTTQPLLVSIKQAAAMLALSRSSIYLLMDSGELSPVRIGRSVRFTVEQLEQFVAERSVDSSDETRAVS